MVHVFCLNHFFTLEKYTIQYPWCKEAQKQVIQLSKFHNNFHIKLFSIGKLRINTHHNYKLQFCFSVFRQFWISVTLQNKPFSIRNSQSCGNQSWADPGQKMS